MPTYNINGQEIVAADYNAALSRYRQGVERTSNAADAVAAVSALAEVTSRVDGLGVTTRDQQSQLQDMQQGLMAVLDRLEGIPSLSEARQLQSLAAQMVQLAGTIQTEGSRAINKAMDAQGVIEQSTAGAMEAAAVLSSTFEAEAASIAEWKDLQRADVQGQLEVVISDVRGEAQRLMDLEAVGIAEVRQEKPESFVIQLTNGVVHEVQLPRGPRGYRGAQGASQAVGGGGGGGSAGSKLIGAAAELTLTASQEVEVRHRTLTQAVKIKGDADFRVKVVAIGNPDQWSSFTLSSAAATAAAPTQESAFSIAPDFSGVGGEIPMAFRVVRLADGTLQLFATAGVDCSWTSTIAAVTEV